MPDNGDSGASFSYWTCKINTDIGDVQPGKVDREEKSSLIWNNRCPISAGVPLKGQLIFIWVQAPSKYNVGYLKFLTKKYAGEQ